MIVNKERICPPCIVAQHEARKCPLRNGVTMCRNCRYTHAREMGCRPQETIWRREDWHCFNTASSQHRDESTREILSPPPPARTPKKKAKRKKKSKAAPREKLSPPPRLELPQKNQNPEASSRENVPVPVRQEKNVRWPQEGEVPQVREVSRWMSDEWGKFKNPVWENGKCVEACEWVKESDIDVIGTD